MSESLRLALLNGGLLAVGEALLAGLGLVRGWRAALRLAGLAYVVAWAATGVGISLALVVGVPFRAVTVLVLWGLLVGAATVVGLRLRSTPLVALPPSPLAVRGFGLAAGASLAGYLVFELLSILGRRGFFHPDVWGMWLPRGETIYYFGGLDTAPGGYTSFAHGNYPPFVPSVDATTFAFLGRADVLLVGPQHWVLIAAFLAALAGLLAYRVRAAITLPCLLMVALLPAFHNLAGSGLGDETLMVEFALAGLLIALWLPLRDPRLAVLAGLFLVAAVLSKSEGLLVAVAVGVVALVAAGRSRWRWPVAFLALIALARISWWAWLVAHHVPRVDDYKLSDALHPGYLSDRFGRLGTGIDGLLAALLGPGRFYVTAPLALAAAALCIRLCPRVVGFVLGTGLLVFAGYAVIYWISPMDIDVYIDTSARRIVTPIGVFWGVLLPLFLAERLAPSSTVSSSSA